MTRTFKEYQELNDKLTNMVKQTDKQYDWKAFVKSVIDWNYVAGDSAHDYSIEKVKAQRGFIVEEFNEVCDALAENNLRETIKELVDLVVVSSYAMFLDGKNPDYHWFDINPFFRKTLQQMFYENISYGTSMVPDNVYQWAVLQLEQLGNFEEIADGILEANWTKIPTVEDFILTMVRSSWTLDRYDSDPYSCPLEVAANEQIKFIESEGRYVGVTYKLVDYTGKQRIVFKDSTGKVVKPVTFKKFK